MKCHLIKDPTRVVRYGTQTITPDM